MKMSLEKNRDLIEIIKERRSIRRYLKKKVSANLINKVVEAATWAPTTCNQQLWNFIVVKDIVIKNRLVSEAASSTTIKRAPTVIVITYEKSDYKEAIQSATTAMQNLLLAATYYGLGSCSMNSFGNEKKIKEILEIPDDQLIACFVTLGYKDSRFYDNLNPPPRRELNRVLHFGTFKKRRRNIFSYNPDKWTLEDLKDYQRYYCRKTFLGKEMDIATHEEKDIVPKFIGKIKGPVLDWFTYDGMYLPMFPDIEIFTVDLTDETSNYTKAATSMIKGSRLRTKHLIYETSFKEKIKSNKKFRTITAIYKLERISNKFKDSILKDSYNLLADDGEFIAIFRKKSILYRFFYVVLRMVFGDDIRNTGIYSFFGPYRPMNSKKFVKLLRKKGFKNIKKQCYFPFPTFFDQALQMFLLYIKSGGTTYLHRQRIENFMTKFTKLLINIYGFRQTTFGTVCVVRAKKN